MLDCADEQSAWTCPLHLKRAGHHEPDQIATREVFRPYAFARRRHQGNQRGELVPAGFKALLPHSQQKLLSDVALMHSFPRKMSGCMATGYPFVVSTSGTSLARLHQSRSAIQVVLVSAPLHQAQEAASGVRLTSDFGIIERLRWRKPTTSLRQIRPPPALPTVAPPQLPDP